jgi:glycosyltransferase involved in cell wall biosynthesis
MRFSIVIPVYNREEYIRQAVDSVLSQTFQDYQLIVIDDESTDRTAEVLQSYGTRLNIVRQKKNGAVVARRRGVCEANGEYIAFLDSDDLLMPCALATYDCLIRAFNYPAVILGSMTYFTQARYIPTQSRSPVDTIEVIKYRDCLAKKVHMGMSCSKIVVRKNLLNQIVGTEINGRPILAMQDHHLLLQLGTQGPCIVVKNPITVAYRTHATNNTNDIERMVEGTLSLIQAERRGYYPGGWNRRFSRYAYIGGKALDWIRKALKRHRPDLALRLILSGGVMIAAAALKEIWRNVLFPKPSIFLRL